MGKLSQKFSGHTMRAENRTLNSTSAGVAVINDHTRAEGNWRNADLEKKSEKCQGKICNPNLFTQIVVITIVNVCKIYKNRKER